MSSAASIATYTTVRPSVLLDLLKRAIRAMMPVYITGEPGCGKSSIVRKAAADLGLEFIDVRAVLLDPVDLRGLPYVRDGVAYWAPPSFLPTSGRGVLFLDELAQATPAVQAALLQLVLDRRLGEYVLPDGWTIVAAGNRQQDRAGGHRIISALGDRFCQLNLEQHNDDWHEWARDAGIHPTVRGYIKWKPDNLQAFRPDQPVSPTARSWAFVSRMVPACEDNGKLVESALMPAVGGIVGIGCAAEFVAYVNTYASLPDPEEVIKSPETYEVPTRIDVKWALCMSLGERSRQWKADKTKLAALIRYAMRLTDEFAVMLFRDAQQATDGQLVVVKPEASQFFAKFGNVISVKAA